MKKASFLFMSLVGLVMASGGAYAHSDEYLDMAKAPHDGQLRMAGIYHYELEVVKDSKEVKDNPITVFVTDHAGKKVLTAGAIGTATILAGKMKVSAALIPDGDNRMKGSAKYASTSTMKAVISITLPNKSAEQARFSPLTTGLNEHMDHKQ
ncbi:MAG: hypothetical protein A3K04_11815 [Gallionellales bacterium RBG_16_56_9]|nr:MAG: hypothetical protein A3K04_11815 [Gallionellales bacterium RBG_16_56_9]